MAEELAGLCGIVRPAYTYLRMASRVPLVEEAPAGRQREPITLVENTLGDDDKLARTAHIPLY